MSDIPLTIEILEDEYCIFQLSPGSAIPEFENHSCEFMTISISPTEISIVGPVKRFESDAVNSGWACLRISGQLDFDMVGIIARLSTLLSNAAIPIFVISTYETDYFLVKRDSLSETTSVLQGDGIIVRRT